MGLASSSFIVLRLMESMSAGVRLGSSPVKLRSDGYTHIYTYTFKVPGEYKCFTSPGTKKSKI